MTRPAQHNHKATSLRTRLWLKPIVAAAAALLAATGAAEPAVASPPYPAASRPDTAQLAGYDFFTEAAADVITGEPDLPVSNNLLFTYTAGTPLEDGTVVLSLLKRDWPTPLAVDPAEGNVVVQPRLIYSEPSASDCRGTVPHAIDATVAETSGAQTIVARGINCEPGQQLAVEIHFTQAPARPGRYSIGVTAASHGTAARFREQASVPVLPRPRSSFSVHVPSLVREGQPTPVTITARTPRGRVDTSFRGAAGLTGGRNCMSLIANPDAFVFTAEDRGRKTALVRLTADYSQGLIAYGVQHRQTGASTAYTFVNKNGGEEFGGCSVSYH